MRIITGKLKGRKIPVPNTGKLRPTADRTKEAIFSILTARRFLEGTTILDLFAGTGSLGFEAISRGADQVLFVEHHPDHVKQIEKLGYDFKIKDQIRTTSESVESFLEKRPASPYHYIFSDPPYDYPWMQEMVEQLLTPDWLEAEGWLILEHDKRHDFSDHPACFHSKGYGRTIVSIFQLAEVRGRTAE